MREQESRIPRLGVAQKHTHNVTLRLLYRVGRRALLLVAYFSYTAARGAFLEHPTPDRLLRVAAVPYSRIA